MWLSCLEIKGFRNLTQARLELHERCNCFYGPNGAGKTSVLEAIYYLFLGRSFRHRLARRVIQDNTTGLTLFGELQDHFQQIGVGIEHSLEKGKKVKLAGKVATVAEIARLIPVQLLNYDSYLLLQGEPSVRRQFIDWGLFHVKPSFFQLWLRVLTLLKQRNAAIRARARREYLTMWDQEFAAACLELHNYRKEYLSQLIPIISELLVKLGTTFAIEIYYDPGWEENRELSALLTHSLLQDLKLGYTTVGAHRADLKISSKKSFAKDVLSRGQQKLLICVMQLAQGILLNRLTNQPYLYLIDDLLAELDASNSTVLIETLLQQPFIQFFFADLDSKKLGGLLSTYLTTGKEFHLANGEIIAERLI